MPQDPLGRPIEVLREYPQGTMRDDFGNPVMAVVVASAETDTQDGEGRPVMAVEWTGETGMRLASDGRPIRGASVYTVRPADGRFLVAVSKAPYAFANAEAEAVSDRMTVAPTEARKALIDTLVGDLKAEGVWAKLKVLYVLAAHSEQAALLNWVEDANNPTVSGVPVFTVDDGYSFGASNAYLATGFIPSVDGGMALNDAHYGLYRTSSTSSPTNDIGFGAVASRMSADASTGGSLFGGATNTAVGGVPPQHVMLNRAALNTLERYVEGALGTSVASTPAAVATGQLHIGAYTSGIGGTTARIGIVHAGTGLTAAQVLAARTAFNDYLVAIGSL